MRTKNGTGQSATVHESKCKSDMAFDDVKAHIGRQSLVSAARRL